ncbi:CehA/McbA family metallohydrolase [Mesorhizobium sp. Cs1299R1N3]|uniref:CehA/McbA family metallohydrolase n=1 Tax=Mesorhizobium sp. Cs1299R1N3 TaxID=3015173 RepID=UPI00301C9712
MITPPSPHFRALELSNSFNRSRKNLGAGFAKGPLDSDWSDGLTGPQALRGIPFLFGVSPGFDVVLLRPGEPDICVEFPSRLATYVVFVQAVADRPPGKLKSFRDALPVDSPYRSPIESNDVSGLVSTYVLRYADGSEENVPVYRRIAIQQRHISWGASPFAAMPALGPHVHSTHGEDFILGRAPRVDYDIAEARNESGRLSNGRENLWIYALPNPHPQKELAAVQLRAEQEESIVYAISTTGLADHPLRLQNRTKLRLRLPEGVHLNALGELDTDDRGDEIGIDLGTVISARAVLEYSTEEWKSNIHDVQPRKSNTEVIVEYSAHPDAHLYVRSGDGDLLNIALRSIEARNSVPNANLDARSIQPANKPVKISIVEKSSGQKVAARLHIHGQHGEYLPPRGYHRKVNIGVFQARFGELANDLNQYAYVKGDCTVDLPTGPVFIEISRGFEFQPIRRVVDILPTTETLTFELDDVLQWREKGWVTSDTHVHYLNPHTALLEGQAEGVNVVNLLATQWGELIQNATDFDGRTTLGAKEFGGDGEFLVRVGTENRMQVLGHISLLGYEGPIIDPLCAGGADEGAIGDPLDTTLAQWAERCRDQRGLVVMPHAPSPQGERAADIVLGLVDAIEVMTFNPRRWQIGVFAIADWYRYLNIGYQVPLVAGSDKMDAASIIGGIRTYAHLGPQEFTYGTWMDAIRGGDTFITVGPLVRMTVEGKCPGSKIRLAAQGGTVVVNWQVESVSVPPKRVEILQSGIIVGEVNCDKMRLSGHASVHILESSWLAIRVRGSVAGRDEDIAAHTSAVFVEVGDKPIFATSDAVTVLAQIEGTLAYLDTVSPKTDEQRRSKMRATLELAHHRLHQQLHKLGAGHGHTPVHGVHRKHEH